MIQHTRFWTATMAAAALVALPLSAGAQSSTTTSSAQQGQYDQQQVKSPAYHLEQAQKVLDRIEESSLTGATASTVRELKQNFEQLRSAYNSGSSSSAASGSTRGTSGMGTSGTATSATGTSGTSGTSTSGTSGAAMYGSTAAGDWRQSFGKIQQSLDQLNVPKSSAWMPMTGTSGGSGTAGTSTSGTSGTSTSGTSTSTSGSTGMSSSSIDPSVMSDLKEFRQHVEEFYKAAAGSGFAK